MNAHSPIKIDVNSYIGKYVRLRDKIKEIKGRHKSELAPYNEMIEQLDGVILAHLDASNVKTVSTDSGTAYKTLDRSATIADKSAFWSFVVINGKWDMIDYKANVSVVADYIAEQEEAAKKDPTIIPAPPPGVNYSTSWEIGVRRKTKTA